MAANFRSPEFLDRNIAMAAATKIKPAVVPGVALEFMPLEQALKILCMSHVDLLRVMATSPSWTFPATLDGQS
jgi:hypothetical protein